MTPLQLVQRQFDAYNARDLTAFTVCYSETVQVFRPPAPSPALSGKAAFAAFYASERFNRAGLRAELLNRMVLGQTVIDHERIHGVTAEPLELAVVYLVQHGLIQNVHTYTA